MSTNYSYISQRKVFPIELEFYYNWSWSFTTTGAGALLQLELEFYYNCFSYWNTMVGSCAHSSFFNPRLLFPPVSIIYIKLHFLFSFSRLRRRGERPKSLKVSLALSPDYAFTLRNLYCSHRKSTSKWTQD
jgi:hypothetical protein